MWVSEGGGGCIECSDWVNDLYEYEWYYAGTIGISDISCVSVSVGWVWIWKWDGYGMKWIFVLVIYGS